MVLLDNGGDSLSIPSGANGTFTFPIALPSGSPYNVTVQTSPAGETCTVANASGTVGGGNITNVTVTCGVSSALPASITNITYYYFKDAEGNYVQNVNFSETNGYLCSAGDLAQAYANDSQYTLEPLAGAGSYSYSYYLPFSPVSTPLWGINTATITCFGTDVTGTTTPIFPPGFSGPLLIINPATSQPAPPLPQLAINQFTADGSTNTVSWSTTNSNSMTTVCSILDEFSSYNQIVKSSTVTNLPVLNLPPSGTKIYANSCAAATIPFPDTITLSCSDQFTGTAAATTTVTWSVCD